MIGTQIYSLTNAHSVVSRTQQGGVLALAHVPGVEGHPTQRAPPQRTPGHPTFRGKPPAPRDDGWASGASRQRRVARRRSTGFCRWRCPNVKKRNAAKPIRMAKMTVVPIVSGFDQICSFCYGASTYMVQARPRPKKTWFELFSCSTCPKTQPLPCQSSVPLFMQIGNTLPKNFTPRTRGFLGPGGYGPIHPTP